MSDFLQQGKHISEWDFINPWQPRAWQTVYFESRSLILRVKDAISVPNNGDFNAK